MSIEKIYYLFICVFYFAIECTHVLVQSESEGVRRERERGKDSNKNTLRVIEGEPHKGEVSVLVPLQTSY